jgi:DNA polymerase-3 subunit beta
MKFKIGRETLLRPLQLVSSVVERRQTLPVLGNLLVQVSEDSLTLTGTDLEVELVGRVPLDAVEVPGEVTIPARKWLDICRALPEGAELTITGEDQRVRVQSGRSRFQLATLPASDFPSVEDSDEDLSFTLRRIDLKHLIDRTGFSMAQQDVRYFLNGMLFEVSSEHVRTVATDGHRLAMCTLPFAGLEGSAAPATDAVRQVIVPRKGVIDLSRLLADDDAPITVRIGGSHLRAQVDDFVFTTKLVDGKFPDYQKVIPQGHEREFVGDRDSLRQAFSRAAILSNEKYRGVRLVLEDGNLLVQANNPDQEEAEETVAVEYGGPPLEIGFNVSYLNDVLNVLDSDSMHMSLRDPNSSAILREGPDADALYVIMPMRL